MMWIAIAPAILAIVIFASLVMTIKVGLWLVAAAIVGLIFFVALAAVAIWLINWWVMGW